MGLLGGPGTVIGQAGNSQASLGGVIRKLKKRAKHPKPGRIPIAPKWEFPKIRGAFLEVPIIRTIVFGGLYWGPLLLGNYRILALSDFHQNFETYQQTNGH